MTLLSFTKRPAFRQGTTKCPDNESTNYMPKKRRHIRPSLRQNAFDAPPIKARHVDFDGLQEIDLAQQGSKVTLSDKTLSTLLDREEGDPTDKEWLEEYERRITEDGTTPEALKVDLPLGRRQRTVIKRTNIGTATNNIQAGMTKQMGKKTRQVTVSEKRKEQSPVRPVKNEKLQQSTISPAATRSSKKRRK
jgi:hypothetical protein